MHLSLMDRKLKKKFSKIVDTRYLSEAEWRVARKEGLGGSEAAPIIGMSKYQSRAELWARKLDLIPDIEENEAMFWGKQNEEQIARMWQYYDPKDESKYMVNRREKKIVRKCVRRNKMVFDDKHPFLLANIDRFIPDQLDGRGPGILECKNISTWNMNQYSTGIPPEYAVQVQHYLYIYGLQWGEMALLIDGRKFRVYPFERDEEFIRELILKEVEFWENCIEPAKQYVDAYKELKRSLLEHQMATVINNQEILDIQKAIAKIETNLYAYEPSPEGSLAYEDYLKTRFTDKGGIIIGNEVHYELAKKIRDINGDIKKSQDRVRVHSNEFKFLIGENNEIDFGSLGRVTYKANKNGVRSLNIDLK